MQSVGHVGYTWHAGDPVISEPCHLIDHRDNMRLTAALCLLNHDGPSGYNMLSGEALKRYSVTCTLLSLPWYEIKDVPIYRCKSFKFRTLGLKFRYIYCS